jgi:cytochrome b561
MDETSNRPGLPGYLQATEQRPLPARPIQALRAVNEVEPAIAPARPAAGYTLAMESMHWASVALCLGAFLVAWGIGNAAGAEAAWLVMVHRSLSVTILTVIGLRLAGRLCAHPRLLLAKAPADPRPAARASVIVLYVLLAAQPLMGLTASMLYGDRIVVFGGIEVPSFLAENEPLARQILQVHGWAALLLLALIGLHVGAALRDRFVRHDKALAGLLSAVRRPHRPGTWEMSKRRHDKAPRQEASLAR